MLSFHSIFYQLGSSQIQDAIHNVNISFEIFKIKQFNILRVKYCQISNISLTLVGNKIVDNSDAVAALPVGTAPTTSSFST